MPRFFKLTVAYDGTNYSGWQVQPEQRTIQGELQSAIRRATKHEVAVIGSGRTDAGVHAIGQVASIKLPEWTAGTIALTKAINSRLPETISVLRVDEAPDDFHAIRDAIGKRYRYQLQVRGNHCPFEHRYRWRLRRAVDIDAMQQAAERIVGEKDFASFQSAGADRKTTVRDVRACDVIVQNADPERFHVAIEVESNGFLYNMVRNIVGTVVEVGFGKQPPEWIDEVISAQNRIHAGQTAPPQGLFLLRVDYDPM
ncbi:tRNA pseudouridine(38-40) synthase TruA [Stieleria varia]|uniref:tRNA pseudouridine synthase A n=1 Tax=Stieleria varia TaxID=2528005 RepID=A0A5C6AGJ6_9BACT|nr:tRNA pseudouridine(38-40) synthase TruA [Stieleria varia]TWT98315.1 tRNA pseudouridine synthase A [Stieleria varia]